MLEVFKNNGDLHSTTGALVYGVPVSKHENPHLRRNGKVINFLTAYGGGASKLHKAFKVSTTKAREIINNFYKAYPDLKIYFEKVYTTSLENGYITMNKLGYRCYLPEFELIKYDIRNRDKHLATIRRKSQNYPIQSGSAVMTKIALVLLRKRLKGIGIICLAVHDEIVIECDIEFAEQAKTILESCMTEAAKFLCNIIPPKADAVITINWNK